MLLNIDEACSYLLRGEPVALPTETVYGLAAPLNQPETIDKIFSLKGRPKNNPLIIHLSSLSQILPYINFLPESASLLANAFWPGPLTLILPIKEGSIPQNVTAGLKTAAFRIPNNPLSLAIIEKIGPLVMPSANISGKPSATQASHVENDFGANFPVVDGGPCSHGLESTILMEINGFWKILRQGAIPAANIEFVLEQPISLHTNTNSSQPLCPGSLYRHYAPTAKLHLTPQPDNEEAIVGFSDRQYPPQYKLFLLGHSANPEEIASNLYSTLRSLDSQNIQTAWIDSHFPHHKLYSTIHERLIRGASAPLDPPKKG